MSYILDALKKAAEQRDAQAPAMRRLFSPVPEFTESPRWRLAAVGGAAAVAGAVVAVWALWPTASVVTGKSTPPPAMARVQPEPARVQPEPARVQPEPARVQPEPAPVQPAAPAPPVVRTAPKPAAPVKPAVDKRPAPPPAGQTRQTPVESVLEELHSVTEHARVGAPPTQAVQPPAPVQPAPVRPQPTPPPVIAAVRPNPVPAAAPPPATATPRAEVGGQMRLEVIVYSDERARRLAFINGRKYVEGDVLLDGSRIQEIQPNAVVIIDDGRRVVLKP